MPQTKTLAAVRRTSFGGVLSQFRAVLTTVLTRRRERAMLARLDSHLLRDIGLDPQIAASEADKPCWRV